MKNKVIQSFKEQNYKLFIMLFAMALIPLVYKTLRLHFIGNMPDTYSFSMAANMQWIEIFFEVLQEAFILPMFFIISKVLKTYADDESKRNRILMGKMSIILVIYIFAIVILLACSSSLLQWLSPKTFSHQTLSFIRVEMAQRIFSIFVQIGLTFLILKSKNIFIFIVLLFQTILICVLDIFMISSLNASAKLGIVGVSIDDSIVNALTCILVWVLTARVFNIKWDQVLNLIWRSDRKLWMQCFWSGIESFVRNGFFIWFVIKTIGRLSSGYSQGDFWNANNFIWDWLLLPIITIGQYINRNTAIGDKSISIRLIAPFIIVGGIIVIWLSTIPTHMWFIKEVMGVSDANIVAHLTEISIGFYVLFAFNELVDKFFYGEGKSQFLLFQSLFTNIVVYVPYYFATKNMTLDDVALMMATSIAVDSTITFIMFCWEQHLNRKNSSFTKLFLQNRLVSKMLTSKLER